MAKEKMLHGYLYSNEKPKPVRKSLAKRILEIAKSDMSDQLKEGEIATLFAQEVHKVVFEALKQIQK
jgi:hypothetical protein